MKNKKIIVLAVAGLMLASCGNNGGASSLIGSESSGAASSTSTAQASPGSSSKTNSTSSAPASSSEAAKHTVTFKADGVVVEVIAFTEGDTSVAEPAVPAKDGYDGKWENYALGTTDIVVNAIYTLADYTVENGAFAYASGVLTSASDSSLALSKGLSLTHGSYSAKVTKPTSAMSDAGLVFAVTAPEGTPFWEQAAGVSYYFFFINVDGNAYLAKILGDGATVWNQLGGVYEVASYSDGKEATLKVDFDGTYIDAFVNGTQYIRYKDSAPLTGTGVGIRASLSGVAYRDLAVEANQYDGTDFCKNYSVANGYWTTDALGNPVSDSDDAILVSRENRFAKGTVTFNLAEGKDALNNQVSGDTGFIFGLDASLANSATFWEAGVSYYYAFKTGWNGVYLAKVNNGTWTELKSLAMSDFASMNNSYDFRITWDSTSGEIDLFIGGFERIDYIDSTPLTGTAYGFRAQKTPATYASFATKDTIDAKPQYTLVNYDLKSGNFDETSAGFVTAKGSGDLCLSKTDAMAVGSGYEATVTQTIANDCGIVFAVSDGGLDSFWENNVGVSYYFFFLNFGGNPILAKVLGGTASVWNTLASNNSLAAKYDATASYTIKAELHGNGLINCYIDGALVLTYADASPLTGTRVGLRAASDGTAYTNVKIVANGDGTLATPTEYTNNHGWIDEDPTGTYMSVTSDAIAIFAAKTMTARFAYSETEQASHGDNGVIFGLDEANRTSLAWENEAYYFFFISESNLVYLAKISGTGIWAALQTADATAVLNAKGTAQAIVVTKALGHITASVNGTSLIDYNDASPLSGDACGFRLQTRHTVVSGVELA